MGTGSRIQGFELFSWIKKIPSFKLISVGKTSFFGVINMRSFKMATFLRSDPNERVF